MVTRVALSMRKSWVRASAAVHHVLCGETAHHLSYRQRSGRLLAKNGIHTSVSVIVDISNPRSGVLPET